MTQTPAPAVRAMPVPMVRYTDPVPDVSVTLGPTVGAAQMQVEEYMNACRVRGASTSRVRSTSATVPSAVEDTWRQAVALVMVQRWNLEFHLGRDAVGSGCGARVRSSSGLTADVRSN